MMVADTATFLAIVQTSNAARAALPARALFRANLCRSIADGPRSEPQPMGGRTFPLLRPAPRSPVHGPYARPAGPFAFPVLRIDWPAPAAQPPRVGGTAPAIEWKRCCSESPRALRLAAGSTSDSKLF